VEVGNDCASRILLLQLVNESKNHYSVHVQYGSRQQILHIVEIADSILAHARMHVYRTITNTSKICICPFSHVILVIRNMKYRLCFSN